MIPKNITRQHIIKAIEEMERRGIPPTRYSRRYLLRYNNKFYPPKYVISLANKYANGKELDIHSFSGGKESNEFLKKLGFEILTEEKSDVYIRYMEKKEGKNRKKSVKRVQLNNKRKHIERCKECKAVVKRMLEKIYGEVVENYKIENISPTLKSFVNSKYYKTLQNIYSSLQNYRGYKEFVKTQSFPRCDFYVPNPGFIVEFDESQHFTPLRKITLEKYPSDMVVGFSIKQWIKLCEEIKAKDNDPVYRDEQRAWYDTLRDFLPYLLKLNPTVRLFSRELESFDKNWCDLDPGNYKERDKFKYMIAKKVNPDVVGRVAVKYNDENPFIGRIVIKGKWEGNLKKAKKVLLNVYKKWEEKSKIKFLMAPGGFLEFPWLEYLDRKIENNKFPSDKEIMSFVKEGEKVVWSLLKDDLLEVLKNISDYITLGVDSFKEKGNPKKPHIELVYVVNLRSKEIYWTGKSYPTSVQENGLIRISNPYTHFFEFDGIKTMVLGCHDLNIFNPRSKNATGWRETINREFREIVKKEKPEIVLHHPHTAVKIRTWLNAWKELERILEGFLKYYASCGRYYEENLHPLNYDFIDDVLSHTRKGNVIEFIIE